MLRSNLYDYSDTYLVAKWTITAPNTGTAAAANNGNKKVIFKCCAPFNDCISKVSKTKIDHAKDIDVVMLLYNSIEYIDSCSKSFGISWQYYRDQQ